MQHARAILKAMVNMAKYRRLLGALLHSVVVGITSIMFAVSPFASTIPVSAATALNARYKFIDTNYPIPTSGVKYVATNGSDRAAGTSSAPYASIAKAISAVPNGGTVVVKTGVYRPATIAVGKPVTIQAAPHAEVWIKGSQVVNGWSQSGNAWVKGGWSKSFCHTCTTNPNDRGARAYPEQVFINDQSQRQVLSRAEVKPGTFYMDFGAHTIYLGSNPSGQRVEVSDRARALTTTAANVRLLGINFSQYSPVQTGRADGYGALYIGGPGNTLESGIFAQSANVAVRISAERPKVRKSQFLDNGANALFANRPHYAVIEGNTFARNNASGYNTRTCGAYCGISDVKILHTRGVVFKNNILVDTNAPGFWCDEGCIDTTVVGNYSSNEESGIFLEVSTRAIVASNIIEGSTFAGMRISGTDYVKIYNNTLSRNVTHMRIYDDRRANACNSHSGCGQLEKWSRQNGLDWNANGIEVYNNIMSRTKNTSNGTGTASMIVLGIKNDNGVVVNPRDVIAGMDYNLYFRGSPKTEGALIWGGGGTAVRTLPNVAAIRSLGYDKNSIDMVGGLNTNFVKDMPNYGDKMQSDYRLKEGSGAIRTGKPLPADVAKAIGVSAGTSVNRGVLVNRMLSTTRIATPSVPATPITPDDPGATDGDGTGLDASDEAVSDNLGLTPEEELSDDSQDTLSQDPSAENGDSQSIDDSAILSFEGTSAVDDPKIEVPADDTADDETSDDETFLPLTVIDESGRKQVAHLTVSGECSQKLEGDIDDAPQTGYIPKDSKLLVGANFNITCSGAGQTALVDISLPDLYTDTGRLRVYKTQGDGSVDITDAVTFSQQIKGEKAVTFISYSLHDGTRADGDRTEDGVIYDPVYVVRLTGSDTAVRSPSVLVPTESEAKNYANSPDETAESMPPLMRIVVTSLLIGVAGLAAFLVYRYRLQLLQVFENITRMVR